MSNFLFNSLLLLGICVGTISFTNNVLKSEFYIENEEYFNFSSNSFHHWVKLISPSLSYYFFDFLTSQQQKQLLLFISFALVCIITLFLIYQIWKFIDYQKVLYSQADQFFCSNKMSSEKYKDKSFTKLEVAKLMKSPEFIKLMNSRKGEGEAAWNWQKRSD